MRITKLTNIYLILTFLLISGFAEISGQELTIEPNVFENSKKEKVDAEFGRLKVPENRTKKNGKKIEIIFVRFKSTSHNPGYPIVYLAGSRRIGNSIGKIQSLQALYGDA